MVAAPPVLTAAGGAYPCYFFFSRLRSSQVFFCGAMEKASELLGEGVAEPMDFSLLVGASSWLVRPYHTSDTSDG